MVDPPVKGNTWVCPHLGIGQATQRKFPHDGDGGEHIGSPLRDGDRPDIHIPHLTDQPP